MRREVEWAGKAGSHVVENDQKNYSIWLSNLSLSSCPHHLRVQAHLRAYHHHHPTHFPLTKLILMVVNKPAIYTCKFILQPPKVHGLTVTFFWKKHRLSRYPFSTSDHFGRHRCKVLHSPKTLPATPWKCYGPRPAPSTTCSRIQNKTLGYSTKDNQYMASGRRWQVESNDGQFYLVRLFLILM